MTATTLLVHGCAPRSKTPVLTAPVSGLAADPLLNALNWVQTSAEYAGLAFQAYNVASDRLRDALADRSISALPTPPTGYEAFPPAVISDLDETVIDNSFYQARLLLARQPHTSDRWRSWVDQRQAQLIPGAGEFFRLARQLRVKIFYVTNRRQAEAPATLENLRGLNLPTDPSDAEILPRVEDSAKEPRRRQVARAFRVLLLLGDNNGDFDASFDALDPDRRWEASVRARERWGRTWIALPNPIYGDWERVLTGGRSGKEALRLKLKALRTEPASRRTSAR